MVQVLVIDDDAHFRALARAALEESGLTVFEASKGRDGLQSLRENTQIQVIVVDGLLPDTNGIKWIENIRASGVTLPIVFVSAFFRDIASFRRLTKQLDVAEVIHKPVDMGEFAQRVRRLVPRRRRTSVAIDLSELQSMEGLSLDEMLDQAEQPDDAFIHDTSPGSTESPELLPFGSAPLSGPRVFVLGDDPALVEYVRGGLAPSLVHVDGATTLDDVPVDAAPDIVILGLPFGRPGESALAVQRLSTPSGRPRIAALAPADSTATRTVAEELDVDLLLTHPVEADGLSAALVHLEGLADPAPPRILVWAKDIVPRAVPTSWMSFRSSFAERERGRCFVRR